MGDEAARSASEINQPEAERVRPRRRSFVGPDAKWRADECSPIVLRSCSELVPSSHCYSSSSLLFLHSYLGCKHPVRLCWLLSEHVHQEEKQTIKNLGFR